MAANSALAAILRDAAKRGFHSLAETLSDADRFAHGSELVNQDNKLVAAESGRKISACVVLAVAAAVIGSQAFSDFQQ